MTRTLPEYTAVIRVNDDGSITYSDGRTLAAKNELSNGCLHVMHQACGVTSGTWTCGCLCHKDGRYGRALASLNERLVAAGLPPQMAVDALAERRARS